MIWVKCYVDWTVWSRPEFRHNIQFLKFDKYVFRLSSLLKLYAVRKAPHLFFWAMLNLSKSVLKDMKQTIQRSLVEIPSPALKYRVSQEDCAKLRESVPYVKVYRYNPKHLCPNLNGFGDNGQRSLKLWQLLHTYWLPNTY